MPRSDSPAAPLRLAHLTTVDMSLALLLGTELTVDVESGHQVFGISAAGPYVERVEGLGVQHVPIKSLTRSWSLRSDLRAFLELFRTLRKLDLDVLHTHTPKAGVMGRIAGRLAGIPVVVNTCHGLWAKPDDPLLKRILVYGAEAFAARFSDFELFQNAEDARTMRRFLKPDRWRVVGNGVDLERFQFDPEGRARLRAEWGVADDEILVGTIGRRVREKGLAEFCAMAHALRDRATFVWVGPVDDTDAAASVPHSDAVRFVGERSDMPAVYSALDVFVLASYREGFSRASMEAAACGRALVLSDIRGCREIGTHGEHVLLAKAQDAAALTESVRRLLDEPELRLRLGAAAQMRALRTFDQRQVAGASLAAYAAAGFRSRPGRGTDRTRTVVLHVLPADLNRGAQVYAGRLRDVLADSPDQEHLVVTLFAGPAGAARPDIRLEVPAGPARELIDPRAVTALRRVVRERGADVVVAHGGEALKYVIPAANGAMTVYYKLGLSSTEIARPTHRAFYGALARRATRVVGVSSAIADQIAGVFRIERDEIGVIPNGRDASLYAPGVATVHNALRVLWVGQFEPGKRPELFLDVVRLLTEREVAIQAAMVGDGPLREELEASARQLGVHLLGSRTDIPDLLRGADLLVFTSRENTEGMPGVLIEAALTGLPVITTPAAGVHDVVKNGETGIVVSSSDARTLAAAVTMFANDPEERRRQGDAARVMADRALSMEATSSLWERLIGGMMLRSDAVPALANRRKGFRHR